MSNFEFLEKYYQLQRGIMFDELVDFNFAKIVYCNIDKSSFWNNALINKVLSNIEINQIEERFIQLKRNSAIYFENKKELFDMDGLLTKTGYKKSWEDSWMFWRGDEINTNRFDKVKKAADENDLKIYIETLDKCFQNNDSQNPYGALGDYLKVAEKVWHKHNKTNKLEYFIVYKDNKPAAVSTLTNYDGIGYISNIGSLKEVRGEGYGKLATLYCVKQSIKNGNREHCMATEDGTYPNEFYKRIGFDTRFTAIGYNKV